MDKIYSSYQTINESMSGGNVVPRDEMPQSQKEWAAEVKSTLSKLKKKFPLIKFNTKPEDVNWEDIKGQIHCRVVVHMELDIDAPYIDSIPYVNYTKSFYNELDKLVGKELGVDKISLNNNGSTWWAYLHSD